MCIWVVVVVIVAYNLILINSSEELISSSCSLQFVTKILQILTSFHWVICFSHITWKVYDILPVWRFVVMLVKITKEWRVYIYSQPLSWGRPQILDNRTSLASSYRRGEGMFDKMNMPVVHKPGCWDSRTMIDSPDWCHVLLRLWWHFLVAISFENERERETRVQITVHVWLVIVEVCGEYREKLPLMYYCIENYFIVSLPNYVSNSCVKFQKGEEYYNLAAYIFIFIENANIFKKKNCKMWQQRCYIWNIYDSFMKYHWRFV